MKSINKYFKVWWLTALQSSQASLYHRGSSLMFIFGKFIRFYFFIFLIQSLGQRINQIAGYTPQQIYIAFLIFNLLDLMGQLFFRGIYHFRDQIVTGEFDFILLKPMSPLFQALTRHTDILDIPLLFTVLYLLLPQISLFPPQTIFLFILLLLSGSLIVASIHIIVAGLGVITTEVDHTIMIYRDLSEMARFPVDIYQTGIIFFLTYVIPIAIAFTYPAKALFGQIGLYAVITAAIVSTTFFFISLGIWKQALTKYSSASS